MAKKKHKGLFGLSDDIFQLGGGLVGTVILEKMLNGMGGRRGGHHDGGGNDDDGGGGGTHPDPPHNPVMNAIEGVSDMTGLPKHVILKGGISVGLLLAAEKMPHYGTAFKIMAGCMAFSALSEHPGGRRFMGIHGHDGVDGTTLAAIEADLQKSISEYKEKIEAIDGVDGIEGTTLAASPYDEAGSRLGAVYPNEIGATNQFSFM